MKQVMKIATVLLIAIQFSSSATIHKMPANLPGLVASDPLDPLPTKPVVITPKSRQQG